MFDNAQLAGMVGDWFDTRLRDVGLSRIAARRAGRHRVGGAQGGRRQDPFDGTEYRFPETNVGLVRACCRSKDSSEAPRQRSGENAPPPSATLSHHARTFRMRAAPDRPKALIFKA